VGRLKTAVAGKPVRVVRRQAIDGATQHVGERYRQVPVNAESRTVLDTWLAARRRLPGADGPALFLSPCRGARSATPCGGDRQVIDVERDELGDPQPGEQQHAGDRPVPDPARSGGGAFGGAQQPGVWSTSSARGAAWGN